MTERRCWVWLAAATIAVAAVGCSEKIALRRYPAFYDPDLSTVAVAPFSNDSTRHGAGMLVARRTAAALEANGTYKVVTPDDLLARLDAADIETPPRRSREAWAKVVRRLRGIDAVLLGTVTTLSAERTVYVTQRPHGYYYTGYAYHSRRRHHYPYHGLGVTIPIYDRRSVLRAHASGRIGLLDHEGERIHSTRGLDAYIEAEEEAPLLMEDVVAEVVRRLGQRITAELAIVNVEVEVDPSKTLRTARPGEDGVLQFTDDFRADQGRMLAVLSLPKEADRNRLSVGVRKADGSEPLAEEAFRWSRDDTERWFEFSPMKLADKAGTGKYLLQLLREKDVLLERDFEINPVRAK